MKTTTGIDPSKYEIGVIIGRFQIHELHQAHRKLIETVTSQHKRTILFLGVSPVLGTTHNPLDFTSRKIMIQEEYPDLTIIALPDNHSDYAWSSTIDARIKEIYRIGKVLLYGGRDSFIPHYHGTHDVAELEQDVYVSGTEIRKQVSEEVKSSALWRAGAIYQAFNRYPVSFQTVDIAPISNDKKSILMAKKPGEMAYRFIGGFVDPTDLSLEMAAKREFHEETGSNAEIGDMKYVSSFRVDDWRYRSGRDKIMTSLFMTTHMWGSLTPSDDISELRWIDIPQFCTDEFQKMAVMKEHMPLAQAMAKLLLDDKGIDAVAEISKIMIEGINQEIPTHPAH
jgi:bifunctional NMN adenylyltransferase/nudix hydrolase